ncbi:MAG: helix-turn-helix domain-containing protein [Candidatus Micrarchaeota archaeon]
MERLKLKMAGEIVLSEHPGATMKKWREIFGITQAELGRYLKIGTSTISDYEGDRRKSPGTGVLKRLVDALISIDIKTGGTTVRRFSDEEPKESFFELREFSSSVSGTDFAKLIDGKAVVNGSLLAEKKVYGYTLLDSIKVILDMPYEEFPKLYGSVGERAFIFTKVSTGRSPMVVIRVTPMKPSVVVLHGLTNVDKLGVKIAQKERIPVITTKMDIAAIKEVLAKI